MPPNGLDALNRRRQDRTTRDQQKLPPKRTNPRHAEELPVEALAHNPANKRNPAQYDDDELDGLATSMTKVGVLQPLGVVRRATWAAAHPGRESELPEEAQWVVRYGNRRLAAARRAGLKLVPVKVVDALEESGRGHAAQIIENIHHRQLDPLDEAADVDELVDEFESLTEVAQMLGKSKGWVTQRRNLLNLVPQFQAALRSGEITVRDARALGAIPQVRQMQAFQAGPPYRDPEKTRAPSPEVTPGRPETYQRSEIPGTEPQQAKPVGGAADDAAPEAVAGAEVSTPEFSSAASSVAPSPIPADPVELARLIRTHLEPDAIGKLIELLNT